MKKTGWKTWKVVLIGVVAFGLGAAAGSGANKDEPATVTADAATTTSAAAGVATTGATPTVAPGPKTSFKGDGTYRVGADIAPGTYTTAGPAKGGIGSCYWSRLSSLDGEFGSIIANENLEGQGVVTIAATDAAFKTTGCQDWNKQP